MDDRTAQTARQLTESAEACLTALESEGMLGAMQVAQIHGFPYSGPKVDIPDLKKAIRDGRELLGEEPPAIAREEEPETGSDAPA